MIGILALADFPDFRVIGKSECQYVILRGENDKML